MHRVLYFLYVFTFKDNLVAHRLSDSQEYCRILFLLLNLARVAKARSLYLSLDSIKKSREINLWILVPERITPKNAISSKIIIFWLFFRDQPEYYLYTTKIRNLIHITKYILIYFYKFFRI